MSKPRWRARLKSSRVVGALTILALVGALVGAYQTDELGSALSNWGSDTAKAEFAGVRGTKLKSGADVKVEGTVIGTIDTVEQTDRGTTVVSMSLGDYDAERLGSKPRARMRATTLLGGKYFVELLPSGDNGGQSGELIPVERTEVPVELDQVLRAVPAPAQDGLQTMARQLDRTLQQGGKQALQRTFQEAPEVLRLAEPVLSAAQGKHPGKDLTTLVSTTDQIARVLTKKDKQLGSIVDSLGNVSSTLASESRSLSHVVKTLPATLSNTTVGLHALEGTLHQLVETARDARPAVRRLGPLLERVDTFSQHARPVLNDLVPVLEQARPIVQTLVPTSEQATRTLDNVSGPVLDRVRGPITHRITSPWHGTGGFEGNGNDNKFYEELGYLAARGANASYHTDKNTQLVSLALGIGADALGGVNPLKLLGEARSGGPGERQSNGAGPGQPQRPGAQPQDVSPLPLPNIVAPSPLINSLTGAGQ